MKCLTCQREATPIKDYSGGWLLIWIIFALCGMFVPLIIHIVLILIKQAENCPYCKNKMF
jgi:DNA-directed RNA polymerase subunit RPC12/RpoP